MELAPEPQQTLLQSGEEELQGTAQDWAMVEGHRGKQQAIYKAIGKTNPGARSAAIMSEDPQGCWTLILFTEPAWGLICPPQS